MPVIGLNPIPEPATLALLGLGGMTLQRFDNPWNNLPPLLGFRLDMIYKVRAKIIDDKLGEFHAKLTDGTIADQKPDGGEIVAAMQRAVLTEPGVIEWFEKCFCPTPLQHERATQYDCYFTDITTQLVDDYGAVEGESFWSYMQTKA